MTEAEKIKHRTITKLITDKIKAALPDCAIEHDGEGFLDNNTIRLYISSPREYMGRFDSGKVHWTINLSENVVYSRTRQVRVKVEGTSVRFDAQKLTGHLAALRETIAAWRKQDAERKAREAALPKLPFGVTATPRLGTDQYRIEIEFFGPAADVQKAVDFITALKK